MQTIKLVPGVDTQRTPTLNEAAYQTTNRIRWSPGTDGLCQKLGGWTKFYPTPINSTVTALHAWEDLTGVLHLSVGATAQLSVITNGVLHTSDLLIHAVGFDLLYRGTLDGKQINAKAEAKLLRDAPVVGWTLSIILKPVTKAFEYKITGSVDHPVIESTYLLPDLLSIPMHPIHSLKSLFPERETPAPIIQSTPQAK